MTGAAREVMDRYISAFSDHDMETLKSTFSPAAVGTSPEGEAEGPEQFATYVQMFWDAFPDSRVESWQSTGVGDITVDEFSVVGTHTGPLVVAGRRIEPTGRSLQLRACFVCAVENGLIISMRLYFDQLDVLAQIGRLPDIGL
ncbi:ester cyclase [Sinosporangium siamense]|uniref:SnoaL-like domain-containing protein n=1 Tax=Sinosporangium siamense TaxID=1367973 RepID=A0A919RNF4_9ACTN|nr:ester cyclase [Sinosporangium siamense]GII96387.1 hypothetical protein Ssi02_66180 [Sinosporangium siamense]